MPRQDTNWGGLHLRKGSFEQDRSSLARSSLVMYAWDASDNKYCPDCEIYMTCPYADGRGLHLAANEKDLAPKCYFEVEYLSKVMNAAYSCAGGHVTEDQVLRIGLELVPLYSQLFKFKLYEYYMKMYHNEGLIVMSEKGMKKVHPIYKEIRETIKVISLIWKDITGGQAAKKLPLEGDKEFASHLTNVTEDNVSGKHLAQSNKRMKKLKEEGEKEKNEKEVNTTKKKRRRRS